MQKIIFPHLIIAAEFIIFLVLVVPLYMSNDTSIANEKLVTLLFLFSLLFIIVVITLWLTLRRVTGRTEEVEEKLTHEQEKNAQLQNQLKKTSQDKIYELQVANGALNREIAERTQAEEEIRELQKQQTLILDSAGEGILGLDKRGRVIFINKAASLMLGWEKEELVGFTHHSRIHHTHPDGSKHAEEHCPIYQAYKDGKVHHKTGDIFWCKNGTSFQVEYVSTPIEDRGVLSGAVVVFRDMNTYN